MPIGNGEGPCFLGTSAASLLWTKGLGRAQLGGLAICLGDSTVCQGELPACELLAWEACKALNLAEHLTTGVTWELPAWEASLSTWERALAAWDIVLSAWGKVLPAGKAWGLLAWEVVLSAWARATSPGEACLPVAWGETLRVVLLPAWMLGATWGEAPVAGVNYPPAWELLAAWVEALVARVACLLATWGEAPAARVTCLPVWGELCQVILPSFLLSKLLKLSNLSFSDFVKP